MFWFHRLTLALFLTVSALPAWARDRESVLGTDGAGSRLLVRSHEASAPDEADRLGVQMDLRWPGVGKSQFALDADSREGSAPRFNTFRFEQKLPLSQYELLPGNFDLGLQFGRESGASWSYAIKPKLHGQIGKLALSAALIAGVPEAGEGERVSYRLSTDYPLTSRLSLGVKGETTRNLSEGGGWQDTRVTPRLSGQLGLGLLGGRARLKYGLGMEMDLAERELNPELQLKLEIPLR